MQFNPTTNDGIVQYANFRAYTDDTNFPLVQKVMSANVAMNRVTAILVRSDDRMKFDDTNYTDLPVLDFDLESGTRKYRLYKDENQAKFLTIQHVLIKDTSGNWKRLDRVDANDPDSALNINTDAGGTGEPSKYDWFGTWLRFDKLPSYSSAGGVKVVFQREATKFETTDTTKEPGFDSRFHHIVPLWMSYDFASSRGSEIKKDLWTEIKDIEDQMADAYSSRSEEENISITSNTVSYA